MHISYGRRLDIMFKCSADADVRLVAKVAELLMEVGYE